MRTFETGATRDDVEGKLDYEGFLSPPALFAFARYMHAHRRQADGSLRSSDNWQKGMPQDVYMQSLWRHFVSLWALHRGYKVTDDKDGHEVTLEEAACACLFNLQGYLHGLLTAEDTPNDSPSPRQRCCD